MRPLTGALAALALLVGGCYTSPAPAPRADVDEARLAAGALDTGDYARAADLYRRAVAKAPDSLPLHYGLAVAASHLDLKPEAIREFRWVLDRGKAGEIEVENARNWLVKVGALRLSREEAAAPSRTSEPTESARASVEGRAVSIAGSSPEPLKRAQIFLVEQPGRARQYRLRTDEEGRFRFPDVAPGVYKLSDRIVGPPQWRLRVEATPGQAIVLNLGPDNSTKVRDDFPGQP